MSADLYYLNAVELGKGLLKCINSVYWTQLRVYTEYVNVV